jgi:hypothetical protein
VQSDVNALGVNLAPSLQPFPRLREIGNLVSY